MYLHCSLSINLSRIISIDFDFMQYLIKICHYNSLFRRGELQNNIQCLQLSEEEKIIQVNLSLQSGAHIKFRTNKINIMIYIWRLLHIGSIMHFTQRISFFYYLLTLY